MMMPASTSTTRLPEVPMLSLAGRRAIVTGGSGGIGAAVVNRFHELGATVGVIDITAPADEMTDRFPFA